MINRQIYIDIQYGGKVDDYLYHFDQEFPDKEPLRMFTGDRYKHTLSEKTLQKLELTQSIEDIVGEVYNG